MASHALEIENLVKIYPARRRSLFERASRPVRAVNGLSFQVPRGVIFGLLGPNGAGKTTLLKILSTLLQPTSGRARIDGFDVVAQPLEVRRQISMVLQETAGELFLSVRDNLVSYARFHGVGRREGRRRADEIMELFGLLPEVDRKVQDLSGGFRRRVQVAKVFLVSTPVLFLDEFSTGMDPILKRAVMESLRREAARGRTIVLTTQILSEAEELCDDILILHQGRQIARGDLNALKLLSQGVYEVVMTFEALPAEIETDIVRWKPLRSNINGNTVELALKSEEAEAIELVGALSKRGRVLHVEISGASLEDIFVELTQRGPDKE
ncbi:MAG TPA: ABC transporter ATP-binding protein [Candidatus Acidoferrales bacterium]|nr:ABC transporter ATP-binding protein [Candidatus Acidoferrales bacterium]